jgi:hypothetical protein
MMGTVLPPIILYEVVFAIPALLDLGKNSIADCSFFSRLASVSIVTFPVCVIAFTSMEIAGASGPQI